MAQPYVVSYQDTGEGLYGLFLHEADMMMEILGRCVSSGRLSDEEALKRLEPYREFFYDLYAPDYNLEEEGFPVFEDEDYLPATEQFYEDAEDLSIPGIGMEEVDDPSPMSPEMDFEVLGMDLMDRLRRAMRGRYIIVDRTQWPSGYSEDLDLAEEILEQARAGKLPLVGKVSVPAERRESPRDDPRDRVTDRPYRGFIIRGARHVYTVCNADGENVMPGQLTFDRIAIAEQHINMFLDCGGKPDGTGCDEIAFRAWMKRNDEEIARMRSR